MKRKEVKLVVFMGILYFVCQVSRADLGAALVDLIADLQLRKERISIVLTGGYISYAVGMFVNSLLADRRDPRRMICIALFGAAAAHIGIRLFPALPVIAVLWCLCSYLQSMIWPSVLKLAEANISPEHRSSAMNLVSVAQHAGSLSCYLIVPAGLSLGGWRAVMLITASACLACGFAWTFARFLKNAGRNMVKKATHLERMDPDCIVRTQLPLIVAMSCLCGMIRDGITTWAPVYYNDSFSVAPATAVLLTALLPASKILAYALNPFLSARIPSFKKMLCLLYATGIAVSALLFVAHLSGQIFAAVALMAVLLLLNGAAAIVYMIQLPLALSHTGRTASISGIADCACYIGAAISSFLFALIADHGGWGATLCSWCALCIVMFVIVAVQRRIGPEPAAAETASGNSGGK